MEKPPQQPTPEKPSVRWVEPDLLKEAGEIARTAEHLGMDKYALLAKVKAGKFAELSDEDWERMENTDSRDTTWTLEEVHEHLKDKRDSEIIEQGMRSGAEIPAPIVYYREEQPPYLIGGNSRLMVARGMKVRPTVWRVE